MSWVGGKKSLRDAILARMKIRIFQIDSSKDSLNVCYASYGKTLEMSGKADPAIYRHVYGGEVLADSLDDVFAICNSDIRPLGYYGRSMSVSDVLEVCDGINKGIYFVDTASFVKLNDFDISKTDHADMMQILVLENGRVPYAAEIRHDIHAMQSVVGGYIEPVYFEPKGDAVCWCNDEFLLNGSEPNRIVGNVLIHGTCYISGDGINADGEYDSCSLTDEQIAKYSKQFLQLVIILEDTEINTEDVSENIGQSLT